MARNFIFLVMGCLAFTLASAEADEHEHHHHEASSSKQGYTRLMAKYALPDVKLMRTDGTQVDFYRIMDEDKPVVLNFIYTSCTTLCPVMTQNFAGFQAKLGAEGAGVNMMSISIDPEQDTPKRLAKYAKKFNAGPQWAFYTGTLEASIALQKAFDAYPTDKMNHTPLTFIRAAHGEQWLRLDGLVTPDDLVMEYRQARYKNTR